MSIKLTDILSEIEEGKKKKVIRKGKLKKKLFCKPGQKAKGNRCVTMKSTEKTKRKLKAKKGAIKRKTYGLKQEKVMKILKYLFGLIATIGGILSVLSAVIEIKK